MLTLCKILHKCKEFILATCSFLWYSLEFLQEFAYIHFFPKRWFWVLWNCALLEIILPGKSPWTEKPGGLQSIGSQRVRHNWSDWSCMHACFYSSWIRVHKSGMSFSIYKFMFKVKKKKQSFQNFLQKFYNFSFIILHSCQPYIFLLVPYLNQDYMFIIVLFK